MNVCTAFVICGLPPELSGSGGALDHLPVPLKLGAAREAAPCNPGLDVAAGQP